VYKYLIAKMTDQWYIPDDTNEEEAALTCRICSRFFTDARSLECGDNFCFCCIKHVQQSEEKIACPVCTTVCVPAMVDLHSLQPNVNLNGMVAIVMQQKGKFRGIGMHLIYLACIL